MPNNTLQVRLTRRKSTQRVKRHLQRGHSAGALRPHYGAADTNPRGCLALLPHNHADQADIGRQNFGFSTHMAYPLPR